MPRPTDGPKCLSRDKPATTPLFLPVGAKTSFRIWARERRESGPGKPEARNSFKSPPEAGRHGVQLP